MKSYRFHLIIILLAFFRSAPAQTSTKNYITTYVPRTGVTDELAVPALSPGDCQKTVTYYDGLGRPEQTNQVYASGDTTKDIITTITYDAYGREEKQYLPFAAAKAGAYHTSPALSTNFGSYDSGDRSYAFGQTVYEASPLNRVLKQAPPGASWHSGTGHELKYSYGTNTASEVTYFYVDASGGLTQSGYYGAGELYKTTTWDENNSGDSQSRTVEYKDKQGRVILKTAYNGTTAYPTYYVYDDFDQLRYVVPPKAVSQLFSGTTTATSTTQLVTTDKTLGTAESGVSTYLVSEGSSLTLSDGFSFTASSSSTLTITSGNQDDDLLYSYRYDGRRRLIRKKIPGSGWQRLAYDSRDRLVLTQDARERARDTTLFRYTLYDTFNRPVQEGLCKEPSGYESVRSNVAGSASYTPSSIQEVLSCTYYDDYDYQSGWGGNTAYTGYDQVYSSSVQAESVKGMVTGTKVRVLGTSNWIYTSTYYDKYGRVIQQNQSNPDGGYSRTSTTYNFTGQPIKQQVVQRQTVGAGPVTTETTYAYDHMGRPTTTTFSYDGATAVTLSENTYDEIGRLEKKTLHNGNQEADYSYNIRGWLTRINDPDDSYTIGKAFSEELYYNTTGELANLSPVAQYNGNLSGMRWRNDNTTRSAYAYRYDGLNRLTKGDYGSITTTGNVTNTSNYDLYSVGYDANGNITGLNRKNSSGTDRENLAYTYAGNQLSSLTGTYGGSSVTGKTFSYDANGNATTDNLRGLTVQYFDELDLPKKYTSSDGSQYAQYTYDAAGTKWGKTVSGTGTTTLKYEGSFIYQDGALDRILTPGGFYRSGLYHYYLKDHLGNTRMVVSYSGSTPTVEQVTEYYPFGSLFTDNNLDKNKYLYNGKELQDEFFENYDYGKRFYDPELARWHSVDPMAEVSRRWSPYSYAYNNPIRFLDPDGMVVDEFQYNTTTQELIRTGDAGGETTQTVTVVNGEGSTVGTATVEGNTVNVSQEGNNVEVTGNMVATKDSEDNTTGYTNQSQTFDASLPLASMEPIASLNPVAVTGESTNPAGTILKAGGLMTAGLILDDATGIGAVDDVLIPPVVVTTAVAAGLTYMGYEIYQMAHVKKKQSTGKSGLDSHDAQYTHGGKKRPKNPNQRKGAEERRLKGKRIN